MSIQNTTNFSAEKYQWSRMSALKLGRYAEHFVCMEFLALNFDVYFGDLDDHGIDLIMRRHDGSFYEFQVKASRNLNYIFFPKATFPLKSNLFGAIVLFLEGKVPQLYIIPSAAWQMPNELLKDHKFDKEGQKSKPEWGVNLSIRNLPLLEHYAFDQVVQIFL